MKDSKRLKVCHLSSLHKRNDTRIFLKECKTLAEKGFDVTLIIQEVDAKEMDGVKLIPFKAFKSKYIRIVIAPTLMFFKALKVKAKVYHFHDPELMITGILLSLVGKKVIYDVHENITFQILNKNWLGPKPIRHIIANIMMLLERFATLFFYKIVAATEEIKNKFPPKKTIVLRNFSVIKEIENAPIKEIDNEGLKLIYAGGLTRYRGIKDIILATKDIQAKCTLYLAGEWESDSFMEECKSLEVWKNVNYLGKLTYQEVYGYLKSMDIGLCVLQDRPNHLKSLPIKAFEYMAVGIPMVMSNFPYWKQIFADAALYAKPNKPEDIATQINKLTDKDLANALAQKSKKLVLNQYSWERELGALISVYSQI